MVMGNCLKSKVADLSFKMARMVIISPPEFVTWYFKPVTAKLSLLAATWQTEDP